jgi:hypothetical protein
MTNQKITHLTFMQPRNLGDLIYSLWGIKTICEKLNCKAVIYQWLNREAFYYEGAKHPTKGSNGNEVTMNQKMFDMVRPLILALPYVENFLEYQGETVHFNLDRISHMQINIPYGEIRNWIGYVFPELQSDLGDRVIDFDDITQDNNFEYAGPINYDVREAIIVNRTSRYRNPHIHYGLIQKYAIQGHKIYFAGTLDEFSEFSGFVANAEYLKVDDFLELAFYISQCKLFIGNQSFCFALAEAMKVPRVLEVCSFAPNVIPVGKNAYQYYDPECFETILDSLLKPIKVKNLLDKNGNDGC